jgi:hypothetical protein
LVVVVSFSIEVGRPMSVIQPMTDLVAWHPIKTEPQCNDPRFYQILGEIFFAFVLLEMFEISQGFKTF